MRTPDYWFTPPDRPAWQARVLAPLGALYARGTARRLTRGTPQDPGLPVICIGNLNAGGTGKTPTAILLLQRLADRGLTPQFLSRGHGGSLTGPTRVDPSRHAAAQTGDEPLLLSAFAPGWIARSRPEGAAAARADGARVLVMDDGFQDPSLQKALSIIVVDAARGFGNRRCIPAGPLREPVATGLARADLMMLIGPPQARAAFRAANPDVTLPVLGARLEPIATGMNWQGLRALAFAGIGHPQKFFDTLTDQGAILAGTHALADHQPLTPALMSRLESDAARLDAQLVTTEKDAVRLPPAFRAKVLTLPVRLQIDTPAPLDAALDRLFPQTAS